MHEKIEDPCYLKEKSHHKQQAQGPHPSPPVVQEASTLLAIVVEHGEKADILECLNNYEGNPLVCIFDHDVMQDYTYGCLSTVAY